MGRQHYPAYRSLTIHRVLFLEMGKIGNEMSASAFVTHIQMKAMIAAVDASVRATPATDQADVNNEKPAIGRRQGAGEVLNLARPLSYRASHEIAGKNYFASMIVFADLYRL